MRSSTGLLSLVPPIEPKNSAPAPKLKMPPSVTAGQRRPDWAPIKEPKLGVPPPKKKAAAPVVEAAAKTD